MVNLVNLAPTVAVRPPVAASDKPVSNIDKKVALAAADSIASAAAPAVAKPRILSRIVALPFNLIAGVIALVGKVFSGIFGVASKIGTGSYNFVRNCIGSRTFLVGRLIARTNATLEKAVAEKTEAFKAAEATANLAKDVANKAANALVNAKAEFDSLVSKKAGATRLPVLGYRVNAIGARWNDSAIVKANAKISDATKASQAADATVLSTQADLDKAIENLAAARKLFNSYGLKASK